MTLRDTIASDAYTVFTSTDDFAEVITYLPRHGSARSINAVVIRESMLEADGIVMPAWTVNVANDATRGIASDELDLGGDQLSLPPRDGEAATTRTIQHIILQDHGMLVLQCQ